MIIPVEVKAAGLYQIEVEHADGTVDTYPWMKNIILDQGLSMGNLFNWYSACMGSAYIGTGGTAPLTTDTALEAQYAVVAREVNGTKVTGQGQIDADAGNAMYSFYRGTFQFPAVASEVIIKECGIGTDPTSKLLTRSRLSVDGVDVDLSLVTGDILKLTYEIRIYPPTETVVSIVNLNGDPETPITVTVYPNDIDGGGWSGGRSNNQNTNTFFSTAYLVLWTGTVPPATPTDSGTNTDSWWKVPYPSLTQTAGLDNANWAGGIDGGNIYWYNQTVNTCSWVFTLSPPLMKDNTMIATVSASIIPTRFTYP
jgi:hypothetical protein